MTNDERILKLTQALKVKQEEVNKVKRFTPITNCSITLDGQTFNLHTLIKGELVHLLVKLNAYHISASTLEIDDYKISGFGVKDWIVDVKSKIEILDVKTKQKELDVIKTKLTSLLSNKKQTELAIDELEKFLK